MLKLIVGLGNPEPEYKGTRHNLGYEVMNVVKEYSDMFLYTFKPNICINDSGLLVKVVCDARKILPHEILVVLDCLALPLGDLRYRPSGSFGGHNGMKSVIEHLGTDEIPRLRLGVGAPPEGMPIYDFVTGKFGKEERLYVNPMLMKAARWIACEYKPWVSRMTNPANIIDKYPTWRQLDKKLRPTEEKEETNGKAT